MSRSAILVERPDRAYGSVPAGGLGVAPRAARRAVAAVDVDQPGVDLPVAVRRLGDAGARPRRVEELRDAVGGAARVLRVRVPAALLAPEVLEAGELATVATELRQRVVLERTGAGAAAGAGRRPGAGLGLGGGLLARGLPVGRLAAASSAACLGGPCLLRAAFSAAFLQRRGGSAVALRLVGGAPAALAAAVCSACRSLRLATSSVSEPTESLPAAAAPASCEMPSCWAMLTDSVWASARAGGSPPVSTFTTRAPAAATAR